MDPTFAETMRVYLVSLDHEHPPTDPANEGRPGTPCTCGDPQPGGRDRHLLEVITEHFAEPGLEPHVVHVDPVLETTRIRTYDADVAAISAAGPDESSLVESGEELVSASTTLGVDANGTAALVAVPEVRIPYWEFDETVRRQGATECPDCGRGLASRGADMICPRLAMETKSRGCHDGCVVACGGGA